MRFSCFIVYLLYMKRDPIFFPLRQRTRHPFATSRHQWPLFFLIWIYSWGGSDVWGPSIVAVVPPYCQAVLCHLCILSSNLTTTTMLVMILQVKNHNAFVSQFSHVFKEHTYIPSSNMVGPQWFFWSWKKNYYYICQMPTWWVFSLFTS